MFGFDLFKLVKKEVLKPDFNHNGVPDALEVVDGIESGAAKLAALLDKFDGDDLSALLHAINPVVKGKLSDEDIKEGVEGFQALKAGLAALPAIAEKVEAELKKK